MYSIHLFIFDMIILFGNFNGDGDDDDHFVVDRREKVPSLQ